MLPLLNLGVFPRRVERDLRHVRACLRLTQNDVTSRRHALACIYSCVCVCVRGGFFVAHVYIYTCNISVGGEVARVECVIAEVSTVSVFSRVCLYISLVRYMLCKCVVVVVERLDQFFFFFFFFFQARSRTFLLL